MKHDFDSLYEGPRLERRLKRKKYNRILNTLIGIVLILIVYFGSQLFFGNDDNAKSANDEKNQTEQNEKQNSPEEEATNSKSTSNDDSQENHEEEITAENNDEHLDEDQENEDVIVSTDSSDENVLNTIVNPSWKPVGTVQSEPHISVYKEGSVDWDEMMKAVNYATGLSESDYIIWWNGRDGDNKSVITIENKADKKIYRVSIEWVKNEGWKPVKVEELKENDKAR